MMKRRTMPRWLIALCLFSLFFIACSDEESANSPLPDGDEESAPLEDGDTSEAVNVDGDEEQAEDAEETEGEEADDAPACEMVEPPEMEIDMAQKKFALSMFHYNVQYVAGGLEVFIDGESETLCMSPCEGWTDERLQDWIITESFEPVLDFYLAHPDWKVTFEMQAMMVEAMAERHPAILEKFREAAEAGIVEVVSFHYSAQLFLAFPRGDLDRSIELTKEIFERYCIPLSAVVFNQEGQAGEGKHAVMVDHGYEISVFPKNLYRYVRHEELRWPYYKNRGVDVIIGPGDVDPESGIEVNWTFFDDGELLTTPADPYFAPFTNADLSELADYEAKLNQLEADGYKMTTITDYVNHLKAQEIEQPELPPVVDGTWQPTSTESISRWMGNRSVAGYNYLERDNIIRRENYQARTLLEMAELFTEHAASEGKEVSDFTERIQSAWRQVFEAEVSDATGITPWIGEYLYADRRNKAVIEEADAIIEALKTLLDYPYVSINLATGEIERFDDIVAPEPPPLVDAPIEIEIEAPTRTIDEPIWYGHGEFTGGEELYELVLGFSAAEDTEGRDEEKSFIRVRFPRTEDVIRYSPALLEDEVVEYPYEDFSFQRGEVYLPLANGLIGLGNDWWVIKNCRTTHIAARVPNTAEEPFIEFKDATAKTEGRVMWHFFVYHGDKERALELATLKNIAPMYYK